MRARLAISLSTALFAVLLALTPARADDAADAKTHYQKATAHYAVGEYKEAASEYEAAYKAKQDPALLYNAAQSHRLAGDNQKALLLYKNIVKLHPTSKYAVESKDRIDKLEQAIATTQSPPNQPAPVEASPPPASTAPVQPLAPAATATPPPGAPPAAIAPAPGTSAAATLTSTPPPTEGEAPVYKKVWFWAVIGAVVVGGTVAAIALSGGSSGTWSNVGDVKGAVRP